MSAPAPGRKTCAWAAHFAVAGEARRNDLSGWAGLSRGRWLVRGATGNGPHVPSRHAVALACARGDRVCRDRRDPSAAPSTSSCRPPEPDR